MMNAVSRENLNGTRSTSEETGWLSAMVRLEFINLFKVEFNNSQWIVRVSLYRPVLFKGTFDSFSAAMFYYFLCF